MSEPYKQIPDGAFPKRENYLTSCIKRRWLRIGADEYGDPCIEVEGPNGGHGAFYFDNCDTISKVILALEVLRVKAMAVERDTTKP